MHVSLVRGQTCGHARRRGFLQGHQPAQGECAIYCAHGFPQRPTARSKRPARGKVRTNCLSLHSHTTHTHYTRYTTSTLRSVFLGGERSDHEMLSWAEKHLPHTKIIDHYWQTETGFPVLGNPQRYGWSFPVKHGSAALPVPGWDVRVIAADNHIARPDEVCFLPFLTNVSKTKLFSLVKSLLSSRSRPEQPRRCGRMTSAT